MSRVFVTSDTHGDYEGLKKCMDDANFNYEEDKLIHCGDIVDRGPDSKKLVDHLLLVKNIVKVMGNHDEWWKQFSETGVHPGNFYHGVINTIQSYTGVDPNDKDGISFDYPPTHREFFEGMCDYYIDDKNRLFIHAGYDRNYLLAKQHPSIFRWDREMNNELMRWEKKENLMDVNKFDRVFYGHCATVLMGERKADPIYVGQFVAIDTGAGYPQAGGMVTLLDITDDANHKIYRGK